MCFKYKAKLKPQLNEITDGRSYKGENQTHMSKRDSYQAHTKKQ